MHDNWLTIPEIISASKPSESTVRRYLRDFSNFLHGQQFARGAKYPPEVLSIIEEIHMGYALGMDIDEINAMLRTKGYAERADSEVFKGDDEFHGAPSSVTTYNQQTPPGGLNNFDIEKLSQFVSKIDELNKNFAEQNRLNRQVLNETKLIKELLTDNNALVIEKLSSLEQGEGQKEIIQQVKDMHTQTTEVIEKTITMLGKTEQIVSDVHAKDDEVKAELVQMGIEQEAKYIKWVNELRQKAELSDEKYNELLNESFWNKVKRILGLKQ